MDEETEYLRMSAAGLDYVEFDIPEKGEMDLLQQLVHERPELDERLVFFHGFVNGQRRELGEPDQTIRKTIYDLLEHTLNRWVLIDEDSQSLESRRGIHDE